MADPFNPFGGITEQINILAQQRNSPQAAQLQFDIQNQIQEQTRRNLANEFLATADFSRDPAGSMRTLGALLNNTELMKSSFDMTLKQRAFEDQMKQLQDLQARQAQFGQFSESLAGEGFDPQEQAQLYGRAQQLGVELPSIPSGAKGTTPQERELGQLEVAGKQAGLQETELKSEQIRLENEKKRKELKEAGEPVPFDLTKDGTELAIKFSDRADKASEDFNVVTNNLTNIESAVDRMLKNPGDIGRIATDQIVITSFNKILDPTSVVRESEYERTPQNVAIVDRAEGWLNRLKEGGAGLTQENIVEIRNAARDMTELRRQIVNKKLEKIRSQAERRKISPDEVAPLFQPLTQQVQPAQPNKTQTPQANGKDDLDGLIDSLGLP